MRGRVRGQGQGQGEGVRGGVECSGVGSGVGAGMMGGGANQYTSPRVAPILYMSSILNYSTFVCESCCLRRHVRCTLQGSHVTCLSGSYILQWKYFDSAKSSFDLLSGHKSKVMYYTELLQSEKFR